MSNNVKNNLKNIRKALRLHTKAILDTITEGEAETITSIALDLKAKGIVFKEAPGYVEILDEGKMDVWARPTYSRATGLITGFHLEF